MLHLAKVLVYESTRQGEVLTKTLNFLMKAAHVLVDECNNVVPRCELVFEVLERDSWQLIDCARRHVCLPTHPEHHAEELAD